MKQEEKTLVNTYVLGIFMLSLLDEWDNFERVGITARIFNTITKKHNNFHAQILDLKSGKRKKVSKKCELFAQASSLATIAWQEVVTSIESNIAISANVVIHNIFRLNSKNIEWIYGLQQSDFIKLTKNTETGTTLSSCRMARLLSEKVESKLQKIN